MVRVTRPSRSSERKPAVSIRREIPGVMRSNSVKRIGPPCRMPIRSRLHLSPIRSSTERKTSGSCSRQLRRIVVGLYVAAHGARFLFGWFGGLGIRGTQGFMGSTLGFRPAWLWALGLGLAEFGGGVLTAPGL